MLSHEYPGYMVTSARTGDKEKLEDHAQATTLFDGLFTRTYSDLLRWCRRHVHRSLGDPEDFVHQAYLRCRRCWSPQRQSLGHARAYFYRALHWVVADEVRRGTGPRRFHRLTEDARARTKESPVHALAAGEALSVLSPTERAVCSGFLKGQTAQQVQTDLQLSEAALAVHLCRARRKMREFLERAEDQ
jgi:RNA polymerase sigma factor (sigma-70 family)